MCVWCAVKYAQCFKCNALFCEDCGISIKKLDKSIGDDELYEKMIEYDTIHALHSIDCVDIGHNDEICLECSRLRDHEEFLKTCLNCEHCKKQYSVTDEYGQTCNECNDFYCGPCLKLLNMDMDKGNSGEFCTKCWPE